MPQPNPMYKFIGSLERVSGLRGSSLDGCDEWNHASQLWTRETIPIAIHRCAVAADGRTAVNQNLAFILLETFGRMPDVSAFHY